MQNLKPFFHRLPQNIVACFRGYMILWHVAAVVLTFILIVSGFDWFYFEHTRASIVFLLSIPAALLGFLIPVLTPLVLFFVGVFRKNTEMLNTSYAFAQSAALAWCISSAYKAFTGRAHPELFSGNNILSDISREFHFGFLQNGIFWGWPSSHTMVAFAIAATAIMLYPNVKMKILALTFAFYVGIGVSLTIHWFSDFAAGAILGTVVGIVVGSAFRNRMAPVLQNEKIADIP